MINVLLVDDNGSARKNVRSLLETLTDDIRVIGEAENGIDGVRLARTLRPDVVLLDMRMPGGDGLDAVEALCGRGIRNPVPVLVYTTFHLDEYVYGAMQRGAVGYLLKKNPGDIPGAIRAAVNAKALNSPEIRERLMADWARSTRSGDRRLQEVTPSAPVAPVIAESSNRASRPRSGARLSDMLTEREMQVAAGMADGLSVIQIGNRIDLSPNTVKGHIKNLYRKSGAESRTQLVFWLTEHGLRR